MTLKVGDWFKTYVNNRLTIVEIVNVEKKIGGWVDYHTDHGTFVEKHTTILEVREK